MKKRKLGALLFALAVGVTASAAETLSGQDMKSLDGQVQEIKSDVLNIASELNNLEERLLFPSNTQVSVFVTIADGEDFRLDAVQIDIDGEAAARHIYSFTELEALQKGGVQHAYTGNVMTGSHEIRLTMSGKLANGKDFEESEVFSFSKGAKPKALGVTLAGPGLGQDTIRVGDW